MGVWVGVSKGLEGPVDGEVLPDPPDPEPPDPPGVEGRDPDPLPPPVFPEPSPSPSLEVGVRPGFREPRSPGSEVFPEPEVETPGPASPPSPPVGVVFGAESSGRFCGTEEGVMVREAGALYMPAALTARTVMTARVASSHG